MNWVKLPKGYQVVEQVGAYIFAYNPLYTLNRYLVMTEGDKSSAKFFTSIVEAIKHFREQWVDAA